MKWLFYFELLINILFSLFIWPSQMLNFQKKKTLTCRGMSTWPGNSTIVMLKSESTTLFPEFILYAI